MRTIQERLTTEDVVENHLIRRVKVLLGRTIKLRFMRGWPDRVVLLSGGVVLFVETKRPVGGVYEPLQLRIHKMLRGMGFAVYLCRTKDDINEMLENL